MRNLNKIIRLRISDEIADILEKLPRQCDFITKKMPSAKDLEDAVLGAIMLEEDVFKTIWSHQLFHIEK